MSSLNVTLLGHRSVGHFPPPTTATRPPAERFASQLQQLSAMGFTDEARNLTALGQTNGNVSLAVERLRQ